MKVCIVAYKGKIIMCPSEPKKGVGKDWWPTGGDKIGCVVGNTKTNLGVSREALELMRTVPRNHDDMGDIDWWKCEDEYAFAWCGSIYRVVNPSTSEAARDFQVYPEFCIIIPNDVPEKAKRVIDRDPQAFSWNTPISIEYPKRASQ